MPRTFEIFRFACFVSSYVLFMSVSQAQEILVGDRAPEFQCRDDQGNLWDSREHVGKRMVVVYFYPADFAFCCTRQAERYRDRLCELDAVDAEVVGISGDSVASHSKFSADLKLNFLLMSDTKGEVAQKYGVPLRHGGKAREVTAARWTFVIDKEGQVIYREADVNPIGDTQQVLDFLCQRSFQPAPITAVKNP